MSNFISKTEKQIGIGLFFFALLTIVLGACVDYYDLQLKNQTAFIPETAVVLAAACAGRNFKR